MEGEGKRQEGVRKEKSVGLHKRETVRGIRERKNMDFGKNRKMAATECEVGLRRQEREFRSNKRRTAGNAYSITLYKHNNKDVIKKSRIKRTFKNEHMRRDREESMVGQVT